ncbi:hydrolase [Leptospira perolatii]|uniref:Hydrolase n=1 Tax=Leptospira perolatii TaxID=2023191 RepID=A0A2M9ZPR1_9LEPT|nr:MBL fold metallo-hydrolase [Leptospira perolatii]PJZ70707.1 hydrolase [Leptospira perolatii]PJZ74056.1 hydrolase [Leptospira perolatii]
MRYLLFLSILLCASYCSVTVTTHKSSVISKGQSSSLLKIKPNEKGPIRFQKISAADWVAERDGLIDFGDPKAKSAKLDSGLEPIQIYYYILEHPKFGTYLIDSGIAEVFRKDPKEWPLSSFVQSIMNLSHLKIKETLSEKLKKTPTEIGGIFLTHSHLDHILGILDIAEGVPIYAGPTELTHKRFINQFVQGATDTMLGKQPSLFELSFSEGSPGSKFRVLDFFGDQSLFIIHVPGHTSGSLAFVVNSTEGLQLVTGDTCHTSWGWKNNVTPGGYTDNISNNRESLNFLQQIAETFPKIVIHPGHQPLN